MSEVIKVEETNIKPVPPSSKIEAQVVENQLENKPIQEVNTQLENINVVPESMQEQTIGTRHQSIPVNMDSEKAVPVDTVPTKISDIPQESTPIYTTMPGKTFEEIIPLTVVPTQQPIQPENVREQAMAEVIPVTAVPQEIQEHILVAEQNEILETIPVQVTPITADTVPAQKAEVPFIPTPATSEQSEILEIISMIVIQRPKLTASKTTAASAKKKLVETTLKRVKVPASKEFKNWDSRSFNLPGGKPSIVYHKEGTTVITATGYHEAPGFKSEDIDKLRNASEEDIRKLAKESFRCQLGFINAYFGNLRENPELAW